MSEYQYKTVPMRKILDLRKRRGQSFEEAIAELVQEIIQEHAIDGWEFYRSDQFIAPAKNSWFAKPTNTEFNLLIFRRLLSQPKVLAPTPKQVTEPDSASPSVKVPQADYESEASHFRQTSQTIPPSYAQTRYHGLEQDAQTPPYSTTENNAPPAIRRVAYPQDSYASEETPRQTTDYGHYAPNVQSNSDGSSEGYLRMADKLRNQARAVRERNQGAETGQPIQTITDPSFDGK